MEKIGKSGSGRGLLALSPVVVFLGLYVIVSVLARDFYSMPMSVALLVASAWGLVILRGKKLSKRIYIFGKAAGDENIIYMIWIFILAGAFAALAKQTGAVEATVEAAFRVFPPQLIVPGLFVAACFISLAVGTSVGTVVALSPLAVEMAGSKPESIPFFIAVVLGGSFFGDNLSFISDTTIAATRSQGCQMSDKFRANLAIVLPAALVTLILYSVLSSVEPPVLEETETPIWLMIPYIVVIVTALLRFNVMVVLSLGILVAFLQGLIVGFGPLGLARSMGEGIDSMGNLIVVTLLASGMLGVIKAAGGIDWLLHVLTHRVKSSRGAQGCIALLTGLVNLCTANNTVAIITVGGITHDVSQRYGISPRRAASLLDTASCVVQCLIPYGAQTLIATSIAGISPAAPFPYLYYPWILILTMTAAIFLSHKSE